MAIKEKLKAQRQHIEDLDKHMSVPHHPTFYNATDEADCTVATMLSKRARLPARASRNKQSTKYIEGCI